MSKSNFIFIDSIIFSLLGFGHLLRVVMGWQIIVGSYVVPVWLSWAAIFVALYLGFQGFVLTKNA